MSDKLLQLLYKHDRYKFSKSNMSRTITDLFPIDRDKLFNSATVEKVIRAVIDEQICENFKYNADGCAKLCIILADKIRNSVKNLNFER